MTNMSPEQIEQAAIEATEYLENLVRNYKGRIRMTEYDDATSLSVSLENHPCPPHQMGWNVLIPKEAGWLGEAISRFKFVEYIKKDLAARIGDENDPENCTCYEHYRERLRALMR